MPLCVNQAGTWRRSSSICIKDSSTWRNVQTSCINQSGTWRKHFSLETEQIIACPLGSSVAGGNLICKSAGTAWIVSPYSSEVVRNWYGINDSNIRAEQVSGCTGWFVPWEQALQNPGYACRTYWGGFTVTTVYWSSTPSGGSNAISVSFSGNSAGGAYNTPRPTNGYVRSFRTVTY